MLKYSKITVCFIFKLLNLQISIYALEYQIRAHRPDIFLKNNKRTCLLIRQSRLSGNRKYFNFKPIIYKMALGSNFWTCSGFCQILPTFWQHLKSLDIGYMTYLVHHAKKHFTIQSWFIGNYLFIPVRAIKKTKPRIHQFTTLKCCEMSFTPSTLL